MVLVADEISTVQKIIADKCSIARFGDGELKLCVGKDQMNQRGGKQIRRKLCAILCGNVPNGLLVGIPRIYDGHLGAMGKRKAQFWATYTEQRFARLYRDDMTYWSAFITRPDSAPAIDNDGYWGLIRRIWGGRNVVYVQGEGREFQQTGIFDNAKAVSLLFGPRNDAFDKKGPLLNTIMQYPKNALVLLSLGPTATVLAHDVCKRGYQALDIGHLPAFYAHIHPKASRYDGTEYDTDKRRLQEA